MNVEGVVLKKLLVCGSSDEALSAFSKLKRAYFTDAYASLYQSMSQYYERVGSVPNLENLKIANTRDTRMSMAISALQVLECPDADLDIAIEALIDQYAQNTSLDLISKFLEEVTLMTAREIQDKVGSIPLALEEKLNVSDLVYDASQLFIFQEQEDIEAKRVSVGISNEWDLKTGGLYRQEAVLLGGKRGAGKSVVCANITAAQYKDGFVAPYFTIEMHAEETFQRIMSILANVPFSRFKKGDMSPEESLRCAVVRADMFVGGQDILNKHMEGTSPINFIAFERDLCKSRALKPDNKLVIIDDRELSLATIDVQLSKLKAKHGDKLAVVIIDYINQIVIEGNDDMYDWKTQTNISKQLKILARKYDVCIVSPYQMDDGGVARFSKGILDACDMAMLITAHSKEEKQMSFTTTKARGCSDDLVITVGIDWDCLSINPAEAKRVIIEKDEDDGAEENYGKKPKRASKKSKLPDLAAQELD